MSFVSDPLVEKVIGCGIAVHRALGPGLLETIYVRCMRAELAANEIPFKTEVIVPLVYRKSASTSVIESTFWSTDGL